MEYMANSEGMNWRIKADENNPTAAANCNEAQLAVLMDIRRELKCLNDLLHCRNFINMPRTLHAIEQNTAKKRAKKK